MPLLHEHGDVGVEAVEEQHGAEEQGEQVHRLRPEQLLEARRPVLAVDQALVELAFGQHEVREQEDRHHAQIHQEGIAPVRQRQKADAQGDERLADEVEGLLEAERAAALGVVLPTLADERVGHGMQQTLPQPHAGAACEHGGDGGGLKDYRHHAPDEDDGQGELGNALLMHVGGQKAREQRSGDAHHGRHGEDHLDGGARHAGIGFAQHGQDGRERREDAVVNGEAEDGDQEQRVLDPEITDESAQRFSHDCPLRIGCGGANPRAISECRQTGPPALRKSL